jgi:hypothetical protein
MHPFSARVGFTNERSSFLAFSSIPTFTLMRAITVTFFSIFFILLSVTDKMIGLCEEDFGTRKIGQLRSPLPIFSIIERVMMFGALDIG